MSGYLKYLDFAKLNVDYACTCNGVVYGCGVMLMFSGGQIYNTFAVVQKNPQKTQRCLRISNKPILKRLNTIITRLLSVGHLCPHNGLLWLASLFFVVTRSKAHTIWNKVSLVRPRGRTDVRQASECYIITQPTKRSNI